MTDLMLKENQLAAVFLIRHFAIKNRKQHLQKQQQNVKLHLELTKSVQKCQLFGVKIASIVHMASILQRRISAVNFLKNMKFGNK